MVGAVAQDSTSQFWGDDLGERQNSFRIVYNNVNGLQIGDYMKTKIKNEIDRKSSKALSCITDNTKVSGILTALERWDANVLCLAETQTAWEVFSVRESVEKGLRRQDRHAGLIGSSSAVSTCDPYKPGGTLTIIDGNWTSRINKGVDASKLGRWSFVTLQGRGNTFFTIITAYRCCEGQNHNNVGTYSTYMQQETLLRRKGITKSPQECFITDLIKFIESLNTKGHEILLCLDANETWDCRGSRINELALRTGLSDIANEWHDGSVPATYTRANSARRIDYLLGSEGVMENVLAMGIASKEYDPVLGDHRPQYVDLNIKNILKLNVHDAESPTSRRLKSSNPKSTETYINKTKDHFSAHNIFNRVEQLWNELDSSVIMTPVQIDRYDAIDRDIYRLCTNSESIIRGHRHTKYVWSPALDSAVNVVRYWTQRQKCFASKPKSTYLITKGVANGMCDNTILDYEEITAELAQAYSMLSDIQAKDKEKRVEFLNSLAEKYAQDNKLDLATAVRELMEHEETRELFRTIRLKLDGARAPQMSEIWLPNGDDEKIVLSDSKEVEEHLLQRNWSQLRQAANTPFADGDLGDLLHFDGTGELGDKIVHGEDISDLDGQSDIVMRYLQGMAVKDKSILNTVKVDISMDEYKNFWKNKRETTVTSPFGLHIGHYRSALGVTATDILEVHLKMLLMPFRFAMVPRRWANTLQILLEKDKGTPWSNRLRIIELFDAQVNAGLQIIFGQRMVANAMKFNQLHPSTYGSIPHRTAQDAVLEKTISMDIMRIKKTNGAIFDCDAKGCYDRIIAALQSVTCRRLGVPRTTSLFFARFWALCKHFVRTRHGTSKDSYMSSGAEMLYGIGQGNGAGPAFWLSNLIVMFFVLDTMCSGMRFQSPWGGHKHQSNGLSYVDDVTLGCTADDDNVDNDDIVDVTGMEERQVIRDITYAGQVWESMLHTNGGLLELKKCYWILISWKWIRGVATLKTVEDVPATMEVKYTETNSNVTIPRKNVEDAPRVLGCHIAADGTWSAEVGKWRAEAARFAKKVKTSHFTRTCGSKIYPAIWLAKLRYIAAVVCFTTKDSEKINNQVVFQCLPASGYNSHFPREVVYGPSKFGGLQWESCVSLQIVEKIKFFLLHVRREDKLGKLLQILTESVQLQSGLETPVLDTPHQWNIWVEKTWLSNVKEGLDLIKGGIHTTFKVPTIQRKHDRALMAIFSSWGIKKTDMEAINRCRIYLSVIFVSDITEYNGLNVISEVVNVKRFRRSNLQWSRQVRPALGDRRVWGKYIGRLCFNTNELITSLGKWINPSHQIWPYMIATDNLHMLRYSDGVQQRMPAIGNNKFLKHGATSDVLEGGFPIQCVVTATGYKTRDDNFCYDGWVPPPSTTLKPVNTSLRRTLGHFVCSSVRTLERLWFRGSSWKIATDGGLKGGIGTCGVVMWNVEKNKEICTSMSAESCSLGLLHSTREELRGNLSAEIILDECNEKFGNEGNNTLLYICDSKSAIRHLESDIGKVKSIKPIGPEMDIILEIGRLRAKNDNITRDFKWVRSHQTKILDADEMLNDRADNLATECRVDSAQGLIPVEQKQCFDGAMATLKINGTVINKDLKKWFNMHSTKRT